MEGSFFGLVSEEGMEKEEDPL